MQTPLQASFQVLIKPNYVFPLVADKRRWASVPFFLVLLSSVLPAYIYFGQVDIEWLHQYQITLASPNISPAEIDNQMKILGQLTASHYQMAGMLGAALMLIISAAVLAWYFNHITRNDERSVMTYRDWFAAQWWISMPWVINGAIACLLIASNTDGQMTEKYLEPLSLGFFISVPYDSVWAAILNVLALPTLWSLYLAWVCLLSWTNFTSKQALLGAAGPLIFITSLAVISSLMF